MSAKSVVLLLSGGLDSALSLAELLTKPLEEIARVHAVIFDYGQTSAPEIGKAVTLCKQWGVSYELVTLGCLPKDTHVEIPCRNLVFIAHAASIALRKNFNCVAIGAEPDSTYADSSIEFLRQTSAFLSSTFGIELLAPVKHYENKYALVLRALELGVPLHLCHSSRSASVDGKCKTSNLFFEALSRVFPCINPQLLLEILGSIRHLHIPSTNSYSVGYAQEGKLRSFKLPAALFLLASTKTMGEKIRVFSTGSWMNEVRAVVELLKLDVGRFEFIKTQALEELIDQELNCDSSVAQWGLKQALSFLPRPRTLPYLSCKITQGHLATAILGLGYKLELPAYRKGALLETDLVGLKKVVYENKPGT